MSFLKVRPQNPAYVEALQVYEDNEDFIDVPLVRSDWLQSLIASRKLNPQPGLGTIVGFVPSTDFEAYLGHLEDFPADQIIYFDSQGQTTDSGVPGGGFVIVSVPLGVQSVALGRAQGQLLQTQVIPVDESGVVVLKFR
jgi:hypothetical protein